MSKYAEPGQQALAKDLTKGTGLYPGDLLMMAARGNLYPRLVDGDDEYTTYQPRLDPEVFQGIRAPLAANQSLPASTVVYAIWGLPDFQTTTFWTAGDPTKIVIPAGIDKVQVWCWASGSFSPARLMNVIIEFNSGGFPAHTLPDVSTGPSGGCTTGPIAVVQGDSFRMRMVATGAGTLNKNDRSWVALQVLETA